MRTAYSYIRFSTTDQAKGDSLRRQSEAADRYCREHDLRLDTTLNLRDLGVSAFKGDNVRTGALAAFLEAVKSGRVKKGSVLILESLDRLSRDQLDDAHTLFKSILRSGVHIVTLTPEREYTPKDLNDLIGIIEPLLYFFRAHEESATKARRVKESWDSRRKGAVGGKPMTTVCPGWLKVEGGKFVPLPERVKVLRRVFALSRQGLGTYAIAKRLNTEGVPPWGRAGAWQTGYLRLILTDRRVLGEYQPRQRVRVPDGEGGREVVRDLPLGNPLPDYFPRVVSEEDFFAALGSIKGRKAKAGRGGSGHENILSGLVYCAEDGSKMYYGLRPKSREPFLDSSAGNSGSASPRGRSFLYRPLEECILSVLKELKLADGEGDSKAEALKEELGVVVGRLRSAEERLTRTLDRASEEGDYESYLGVVASLEKEKKRLSKREEELRGELALGRVDRTETRSVIQLRRSAGGGERERLNRVLRAKVEELVAEVWVLVEVLTRTKKVAHLQVHLKNGQVVYRQVFWPLPPRPPVIESREGESFRELVGRRKGKREGRRSSS